MSTSISANRESLNSSCPKKLLLSFDTLRGSSKRAYLRHFCSSISEGVQLGQVAIGVAAPRTSFRRSMASTAGRSASWHRRGSASISAPPAGSSCAPSWPVSPRQLGDEDGVDLACLRERHELLVLNAIVLGA